MDVWRVEHPGALSGRPVRLARASIPEPGADEVLVRVNACGVCRTDLHVAMGTSNPIVAAWFPVTRSSATSSAAAMGFEISHRDVQVGTAHPAGVDAHEHLVDAGFGDRGAGPSHRTAAQRAGVLHPPDIHLPRWN